MDTDHALAPCPASDGIIVRVHAAGGASMVIPAIIAQAGERAAHMTLEFLTARIPNAHTRKACGRAVFDFCAWCDARAVALAAIDAPTVAAYLCGLKISLASVKLKASALRHWLDFLTERGVLSHNPALSVRTERLVVTEGKTPMMDQRGRARAL